MKNLVKRYGYLEWLGEHRDKNLIKVLTGMRRTGKSTILKMFADSLLAEGIDKSRIVFVNFEEMENDSLLDAKALYSFLKSKLIPGKTVYFFLDEIQNVHGFEKVLDSLYVKEDTDIYVTGSSAKLFSSEIATLLTGRYVEINVLPFSFSEAINARQESSDKGERQLFRDYISYGSLPEAFAYNKGSSEQREYIESVYRTILEKDGRGQ